jgi:hypothetical protein
MGPLATTNITLGDINAIANNYYPPVPGLDISLTGNSYYSYFDGLNGSGTINYNAWGFTSANGEDRIYGTSAITGTPYNYKIGDYRGLSYWYRAADGFELFMSVQNTCVPPIVPPESPNDYDFTVNWSFYDSSYTYLYLKGGTNINQGAAPYGEDLPSLERPDSIPLINTYYWYIRIDTNPSYPGAIHGPAKVNIIANGFGYVTGAVLSNGSNDFYGSTYGEPVMTAGYPFGYTGATFAVQIIN